MLHVEAEVLPVSDRCSVADFPGWPLSLPSKVQIKKCEKCSREFCSTVNYRRHIRIHRRSLNIDKVRITQTEFAVSPFCVLLSSKSWCAFINVVRSS